MSDSSDNFFGVGMAVCTIDSPVGTLLAAASARSLLRLHFTEPATQAQQSASLCAELRAQLDVHPPVLVQLRCELEEYFAGRRRQFDVPVEYAGTAFQRSVWNLLQQIPYGETWSYRDMAERLGDAKALRAVGGANHVNPIAIVIPCHRVINASGALGGYGGGQWRKQLLLDLEAGQQRLEFL